MYRCIRTVTRYRGFRRHEGDEELADEATIADIYAIDRGTAIRDENFFLIKKV